MSPGANASEPNRTQSQYNTNKGKRTYDSVPDLIKPQVKEMLIDLELAELITE